LKQTTVSLLGY